VFFLGITGAQALIKGLEAEGVQYIFGYPGGALLPIYDALLESEQIRHVLVRQEQAAVHAANGYARRSGKVGVALATSGPGATNMVTGIANAYMDSIPVVVLTGQVATGMVGTDAFQEVDITGITIPITKHNYLVKDVKDIPRVLKEAFHIAGTGRPGPVLIDLPKNVTGAALRYASCEQVELKGYKPTLEGHPAQIKKLVELIDHARRPVIYAGGGIVSSKASPHLRRLAELTQIPVTTTLMGLGAFPEDHPLSLGMLGLHGLPWANLAVQEADLLIGMGVRFDDRVTGNVDKFAPKAKIVHLDIDPAEIGKNVPVDLPIVGDLRRILEALLTQLAPLSHEDWVASIDKWKEEYALNYGAENSVTAPRVLKILAELTEHRAVLTTDVGQHQMWAAQFYGFREPGQFISAGGLGTMGYGFPAAVGAQMADPEQLVVAITGDGSFQMHMAELGTAMENELPIKILLFNNSNLGMVRQLQHFYSGQRYFGVDFTRNPDFLKLAEAYGAAAYRINRFEEIKPVLAEALANERLTLIDCQIAKEDLVYPMVPGDKGLHEMILFGNEGN